MRLRLRCAASRWLGDGAVLAIVGQIACGLEPGNGWRLTGVLDGNRYAIGDLDELREAVDSVEAYQDFQPDRFNRRELNGNELMSRT